jgi:hypothetical protein
VVIHKHVVRAVDTVAEAPSLVTNADISMHGPPVQGILPASGDQDTQLLRGVASKVALIARLKRRCNSTDSSGTPVLGNS